MQCAWNMTNEGYAAAEIPGQVIGQDLNDKQKSAITEKMAMVDKCLVSACFPADIEPAFCHHHAASWLHIVAPSSITCVCPPSSILNLFPVITSGIAHEVELTEVERTNMTSQPGTKSRIGVAAVGTTQKSILKLSKQCVRSTLRACKSDIFHLHRRGINKDN